MRKKITALIIVVISIFMATEVLSSPSCGGDRISVGGGSVVSLYFLNNTQNDIEAFWINYDGQSESYGTIAPGYQIDMRTSINHHWYFVDKETGQCIKKYDPSVDDQDESVSIEYSNRSGPGIATFSDGTTKDGFWEDNEFQNIRLFNPFSAAYWNQEFYDFTYLDIMNFIVGIFLISYGLDKYWTRRTKMINANVSYMGNEQRKRAKKEFYDEYKAIGSAAVFWRFLKWTDSKKFKDSLMGLWSAVLIYFSVFVIFVGSNWYLMWRESKINIFSIWGLNQFNPFMVVFWLFFILLFLAILVEKVINREKEIKNEKNKKKKVVTRMMESARISELKKREKKISDAVSAAVLDMDKDQEERFRAKLESYDLDDDEDEYGEKHELSVEESIAGAKEDMLNSNQWHFSYYHKTIFVGSVLSSNVIGLRIQETLGLFSYIGSDDNGYVISSIVGIVIFLSFWSFGYVMGERNTVQKKLKVKNDSSLRTWKWFILFYFSPLLIMLSVTSLLLIGIAGIDHLIISYL